MECRYNLGTTDSINIKRDHVRFSQAATYNIEFGVSRPNNFNNMHGVKNTAKSDWNISHLSNKLCKLGSQQTGNISRTSLNPLFGRSNYKNPKVATWELRQLCLGVLAWYCISDPKRQPMCTAQTWPICSLLVSGELVLTTRPYFSPWNFFSTPALDNVPLRQLYFCA